MFLIKLRDIFLIVFFLSISACGLNTGEKIPSPRIEGFSVGCLNGIGDKVSLYLKGQLDERQITLASNCIQTALNIFKDQVHGQKRGEWTPYELRKFIQDLFLQDNVIRDPLLNQLARLKTVIIGGEENTLTKEDIEKFILFVEILKKEAIFFQPYFKALHVLNQKDLKKDPGLLKTIDRDLKKSINRVSIFFKSFAKPYPLKDMEALFKELDFFPDHHYNISLPKEKINLMGALKSFVFGRSDPHIAPEEWDGFFTASAYLISAHVNWTVLKRQNQWLSPKGTKALNRVINNGILFLSLALQNRPNKPLRTEDFLNLHQHLKQVKIMPEKVGDQGMKSLLTVLFGKVFAPQRTCVPTPMGPVGNSETTEEARCDGDDRQKNPYQGLILTESHISQMQEMAQLWKETQSFIDYTYSSRTTSPLLLRLVPSFFSTPSLFQYGARAFQDILSLKPLYKTGKKIHISTEVYDSKNTMNYKNIKIYSFYWFIADMMKKGYESPPGHQGAGKNNTHTATSSTPNHTGVNKSDTAEHTSTTPGHQVAGKNHTAEHTNPTPSHKVTNKNDTHTSPTQSPGMTQENLTEFFIDLRPFAVDMGWLEKRNPKSVLKEGEAEFIAANVLTFSAEGFNPNWQEKEYLTHNEIVEYLAYAFSFAFSLQELGPALFKLCAENEDETDENQDWTNSQYNKDCVHNHLIPLLQQNTQNMPHFQTVLKTMDSAQKQELAQALIHISYETEEQYQKSLYMSKGHLKNIIMALYFVETTMTRYDKNQNLTLESDEIWEAFPVFQGYISRTLIYLICQESDDKVEDVYAYTIEKEVLPTSDTLTKWDKGVAATELWIHGITRKQGYEYWALFLDRAKLTRVFSSLTKGLLHKKKETGGQECFGPTEMDETFCDICARQCLILWEQQKSQYPSTTHLFCGSCMDQCPEAEETKVKGVLSE